MKRKEETILASEMSSGLEESECRAQLQQTQGRSSQWRSKRLTNRSLKPKRRKENTLGGEQEENSHEAVRQDSEITLRNTEDSH